MRRTRAAAALTSAALVLALAACGEDDSAAGGDTAGTDHSEMDHSDMDGMDHSGMTMNEPDATRADQIEGADLRMGEYVVLATAPPGVDAVDGMVWVAQDDSGTTVTTELSGLEPGADYMLHLHDQACADDAGGEHFRFDPDGEEVPPNEIHLAFTADEDGSGEATVTNDRRVEDGARSIVIHPADAMDNRLACADF